MSGQRDSHVLIRKFCGHAAARGALQKPDLQKIGFMHIFNGFYFFRCGSGKCLNANRSAVVLGDNGFQNTPIAYFEAFVIHIQQLQSVASGGSRDNAVTAHIREVPAAL